jgi:hypothetical protein
MAHNNFETQTVMLDSEEAKMALMGFASATGLSRTPEHRSFLEAYRSNSAALPKNLPATHPDVLNAKYVFPGAMADTVADALHAHADYIQTEKLDPQPDAQPPRVAPSPDLLYTQNLVAERDKARAAAAAVLNVAQLVPVAS